ncbi:MAG: 16S rRNA (guanine(527)-N(7))-methyltransferase RsmG [Pseudomonadota bacterium]
MADADGFGPTDLLDQTDVSRETLARISQVVAELEKWRSKVNLMGPSEFARVWRRHVLDSWQLFRFIPFDGRTVDLGSGSGFPALVLAAGYGHPQAHMTMIESVGKKCAFLRAATDSVGLPATVIQSRVESVNHVEAHCVTARALAPLPKLLDYAAPWLLNGAYGVFPKGRRWQEELTQARESWSFACEASPSLSGDGAILKISEVSRVEN